MFKSKKYHIFYEQKGNLSYAIFTYIILFNSLMYIVQNIKKSYDAKGFIFKYFGSKTAILTFLMELR